MAVIFVCPRGVIEEPFDRTLHFAPRFTFISPSKRNEPVRKFRCSNRKIFSQIIQNLGPQMSGRPGPVFSFISCLDGVSYIFSIAQSGFRNVVAAGVLKSKAVSAVGARLLAADVKLGRPVDQRLFALLVASIFQRVGTKGDFAIVVKRLKTLPGRASGTHTFPRCRPRVRSHFRGNRQNRMRRRIGWWS